MTIRSAIRAAKAHKLGKKMRHAACVFKGGALLATAVNTDHNHAEVNAIIKMGVWCGGIKKTGLTVLSIRVTSSGCLRMAKPCEKCQRYMRENGVRTVLYSNEAGEIERMRL